MWLTRTRSTIPQKNSKRMLAFLLVVIIHVLFVWVLASGLGQKVVEVVLGPVETRLIAELPDEDAKPPLDRALGRQGPQGASSLD